MEGADDASHSCRGRLGCGTGPGDPGGQTGRDRREGTSAPGGPGSPGPDWAGSGPARRRRPAHAGR